MAVIQKLPDYLINQIAAGEVVERPASVVKELVENSIDAGARSIQIHVREGGKAQILIIDDGKGMSREDLELAVERHATSKLKSKNLLAIETMGFRGEALPSIASIARMKIQTAATGSEEAWELRIEGGKKEALRPVAYLRGTRVEITDLFFATPARLKFLRSSRAENEAIFEIIQRIAMAHPEIKIVYINEGKQIASYEAYEGVNASLKRLADVMGEHFQENALEVSAEEGEMQLYGYASLPTLHRGSTRYQYFFVNGRPVKDKILYSAVKAAYQDFLPTGRYPMVALFLELPAMEVDVNVHPAKTEVRFRAASAVRQFVLKGLQKTLQQMGHRASSENAQIMIEKFQPQKSTYPAFSSAYSNATEKLLRGGEPSQKIASIAASENIAFSSPSHSSSSSSSSSSSAAVYEHQQSFGMELPPSAACYEAHKEGEGSSVEQSIEEEKKDYPLGVARAQIHKNYIIAQTADGMVIVDQHAAHERIIYESMKRDYVAKGVARQAVLIPEIMEFSEGDYALLMHYQQELKKFGLVIEPFGKNTLIVREVPALLSKLSPKQLLHDVLDALHELDEGQYLKDKLEELCATFACHSSVRSGRILNQEEMNHLLREMEAVNYSGQCNHGRPTYVHLSLNAIEKLFGRK